MLSDGRRTQSEAVEYADDDARLRLVPGGSVVPNGGSAEAPTVGVAVAGLATTTPGSGWPGDLPAPRTAAAAFPDAPGLGRRIGEL